MSGHSKWATTKNKKAAIDSKRSGAFTKASKNVTLAARKGGDPDTNFSLRLAIDQAKAVNMPKDNIDRAIKRGMGELEGATLEEVTYEGFGPNGIPLLIEGITDNKNRTTPEIRAILSKAGGVLGAQNSVQRLFEHKGVFHLNNDQIKGDVDDLALELLDFGALDVIPDEEGITIYSSFEGFEKFKKDLEAKNLIPEYSAIEWVARDRAAISDEAAEKIQHLIELLEEHDDVNAVFSNI